MTDIHPTAQVADGAQIGEGASIGPYSIVGPNVQVGDRTADSPDLVVGAGGEAHVFHGALEQGLSVPVELAVNADLLGSHLAVGR